MHNCLKTFNVPSATSRSAEQGRDPDSAASYLTDESRLKGSADKIFFPQAEGDIVAILHAAKAEGKFVTVSGGRTGITGGAVPENGWLVSTEKMNRVLGLRFDQKRAAFFLRCQPGLTLEALNKMIAGKDFPTMDEWTAEAKAALEPFKKSGKWHFAPDPTEASATIGGMIACNASGARTFHYGATRDHVAALRMVLADGAILEIKRNEVTAAPDGAFKLVLPDGQERAGRIPSYQMPAVKNAAGYFAKPGMDLLDLFIGSEGTLGIVTETELMLVRPTEQILGVIGFFPSEENALNFVRAARGENFNHNSQQSDRSSQKHDTLAESFAVGRHQAPPKRPVFDETSPKASCAQASNMTASDTRMLASLNQRSGLCGPTEIRLRLKTVLGKKPLVIEYFDYRALNLLREQKLKLGPAAEIPALPEKAHTAVYIELPTTEADMEQDAENLLALLEESGSSADTAWTAISPEETERLKKFRHALPEAINQRIGERAATCLGLTKLGTDFAVPDNRLLELFQLYRRTLDAEKFEYVIFGHIGNNHVHVNILPKDMAEYQRGKEIYLQFARAVVDWGGTVSGEHGIGKLKRPFLELMFGQEGVEAMRAVKRVFDPEGRLNPGNMFKSLTD